MGDNQQSSLEQSIPEKFNYIYSCEFNEFVSIKVCSLEGKLPRRSFKQVLEDPELKYDKCGESGEVDSHMFVTVQLWGGGKPITLPVQTRYKHYLSTPNKTLHSWNEWLKLPLRYCDLPRDVLAVITIWDNHGPCRERPIGGTTISLFGKYGTFRKGRRDLVVWPDKAGDGSISTSTPFKLPPHLANPEITKLTKLVKEHREGPMPTIDWLDRLAFTEIEATNAREKSKQDYMYLSVEFSRVHYKELDFAVVYFESNGEVPTHEKPAAAEGDEGGMIQQIADHELTAPNLMDDKHRKLTRSARNNQTDLKPNAAVRDQLTRIINYPISKQLSSEEEDLIWQFRFYLMNYKQALIKFLRIVKWDRAQERNTALELLNEWTPIEPADALQLLSRNFQDTIVRQYAVKILDKSSDDQLGLYLLQLVQALKYENFDHIRRERKMATTAGRSSATSEDSSVPADDLAAQRSLADLGVGKMSAASQRGSDDGSDVTGSSSEQAEDLATFLIRRACNTIKLANNFFWYVFVETQGEQQQQQSRSSEKKESRIVSMYNVVLKRFSYRMAHHDNKSWVRRKLIIEQHRFVNNLSALIQNIQRDNVNRKKKIDKLRACLASTSQPNNIDALGTAADDQPKEETFNFNKFPQPIPLPLDPEVKVDGIIAENATLFKSNLMPARLPLRTTDDKIYTVMFKDGDDLRQDQLVLQIIQLMDNLLQEENLDLKLTPYRVLATSGKQGFVQIVESRSIAEVLSSDNSIQNYMRKCHPSEEDPFGICSEVMDNYVKSCAGYCVITYLLGIGDRHLDNLMLIRDGRLFHVDFGYMLGRDPKPLPPPMKLSKEMVEAMGGVGSPQYQEFRKYCYTAFLHLRRHANLILNLFLLMTDADVPDIALEPDKTVKKVQDKFLLELSDEEAVRQMQVLIDESVSALFAAMVEQIHKIAQNWRK